MVRNPVRESLVDEFLEVGCPLGLETRTFVVLTGPGLPENFLDFFAPAIRDKLRSPESLRANLRSFPGIQVFPAEVPAATPISFQKQSRLRLPLSSERGGGEGNRKPDGELNQVRK